LGAVALYEVGDARARGRVETRHDGGIARFAEKDVAHVGSALVNGGVYAFDPAVWTWIPRSGAASLERDVLPRLAAAGLLAGHRNAGEFWDIGTPEEWARAERHFAA
jgi:NDP-sugar pyrophosphorylase family protein